MNNFHKTISRFCAELGKNRMLIQGAGGNISWKEGEIIWVKGSGTWLSDAVKEDIFVPINLNKITLELLKKNFHIKPDVISETNLKPSIETILHVLMPQKIVLHLHAIDALAYLVRQNCELIIQDLLNKKGLEAIFLDYFKPGPELANAVYQSLINNPEAKILLLKNHGIVIGADSITEIRTLLNSLNSAFHTNPYHAKELRTPILHPNFKNYMPFNDLEVQELAFNPKLFKHLYSNWVLFPDHAVFLGPKSFTYNSWNSFLATSFVSTPELIFIRNNGVFTSHNFSAAKSVQLRCYYDVLCRIPDDVELNPLTVNQIDDLLSWDAEKHRQHINR